MTSEQLMDFHNQVTDLHKMTNDVSSGRALLDRSRVFDVLINMMHLLKDESNMVRADHQRAYEQHNKQTEALPKEEYKGPQPINPNDPHRQNQPNRPVDVTTPNQPVTMEDRLPLKEGMNRPDQANQNKPDQPNKPDQENKPTEANKPKPNPTETTIK